MKVAHGVVPALVLRLVVVVSGGVVLSQTVPDNENQHSSCDWELHGIHGSVEGEQVALRVFVSIVLGHKRITYIVLHFNGIQPTLAVAPQSIDIIVCSGGTPELAFMVYGGTLVVCH